MATWLPIGSFSLLVRWQHETVRRTGTTKKKQSKRTVPIGRDGAGRQLELVAVDVVVGGATRQRTVQNRKDGRRPRLHHGICASVVN